MKILTTYTTAQNYFTKVKQLKHNEQANNNSNTVMGFLRMLRFTAPHGFLKMQKFLTPQRFLTPQVFLVIQEFLAPQVFTTPQVFLVIQELAALKDYLKIFN